jgi:crotonobetaine/carnitine-CoA ligase
VASELGEDEVMAVVAPVAGSTLDPAELIAFLAARMPHFMVPRYVRVEAALPKTPTNKIQKTGLRAEGVTPGTFDREAAGLVVRRQKLSPG